MQTGEVMRQRGFAYLLLLFIVAIMGAAMAATSMVWHTVVQRDKERDLLYAGHEFRRAIGLYYERTPGPVKQYPLKLEDLLKDQRQPNLSRYLRKIYIDPLTASQKWGLVPGPNGTITGVYSLAQETPIKTGNFDQIDQDFAEKNSYREWRFIYMPKQATTIPAVNQ